ncbi:type II secretion system protein GspM [Litorilituus lipolyticus]|uniref:Type II secretion system protein M n=1 Tax=Litorilituus lipolyticus TaxID=2491017 RepID=A0A502KYJ1_9GAMM|nr:type II secretion system protein M [Litorilituus lipolyticus]TPH15245.1 type II secretion system protein M [Litorilituus lipolyticus]
MKAWWQQLNQREQRLVATMGFAVLVFIIYSLVWQPLNDSLTQSQNKLKRQQSLLTWVQENTQHYQSAKKNNPGKTTGSLSSIINRSANGHQITITRMQPQGEDLQVWIDSAPFTQLLFWLEHLANNEGLQVKSIDLSKGVRAGEVKVRRLQLAKR